MNGSCDTDGTLDRACDAHRIMDGTCDTDGVLDGACDMDRGTEWAWRHQRLAAWVFRHQSDEEWMGSAAVLASSKGHRTGLATPIVHWKGPETCCSFAESHHGGDRINVARK